MQLSQKKQPCKETCILVDRSVHFLETSGSKLDVDSTQKNRTSPAFFSSLQKTTWTCIVEGVVEYCRIVYDILSPIYKVSVLCCDEQVASINGLEDDCQNISSVLKGFGDVGPPKKDAEYRSSTSVFLNMGVAQATTELLKDVTEDGGKCWKRLIVVTTVEDESDSKSIGNWVWDIQNQNDKNNLCHIDLVVLNITNPASSKQAKKQTVKISNEKKQVSPQLDVTTLTYKSAYCSTKIALLVRRHYNLRSTIITGIPMKEEQNAGTSANYDVEVIHSAAAHHEGTCVSATRKECPSKSAVTLKWCTPKANTIADLLPCVGAYRISPAEVNSRPAACLIMFLLQGRTVMLEEPKKSGTKVLTHMLSSHGGEVYIHELLTGRCPHDDPPSISEGFGGRVTNYRVNDFGKFMRANKLAPYEVAGNVSEGPNMQAVSRLERFSKCWPMVISDTLIFNMQTDLEPLLSYLLAPSLTEDQVKDCKKVIFKLQAMEGRNDPLPVVTWKGKAPKKEDQYAQVWTELDAFIEGASTTSSMHKKVLDCLRGATPTPIPDPRSDPRSADKVAVVKPMEVEKEKTWAEERLQQQQQQQQQQLSTDRPSDPRAKKEAVTEAPSDPRKRRLQPTDHRQIGATSAPESSAPRVIEVPPAPVKDPRKSPRPEEKSPVNKRASIMNTNAVRAHSVNMTAMIQPKSSLLTIWSDHMNLTASRLHEEFIGRKLSVNGKFELYQKEEGSDSATVGVPSGNVPDRYKQQQDR